MRRMLLAAFSALCFGASAQITVTSATFPVAGDTLMYVIDNSPVNINAATPPGGNQLWDFSTLQISQTAETVYRNASAGTNAASFPGAELVVIGQTGETYFNVTNNKFEALGYSGGDPAGLGLNVLAKFSPPVVERSSPLNFFDITPQTTNLSLPFSTEQLPDSLFQGSPIKPDSIRVRLNTQRLDVVDGWGTCQIPGGSYPVLRQKRTEYTTTNLDVYLGFLGWVDISQLGGGGFSNFLGTDTTVTFRFYSGTEKEEIAIATMSNDLSTVEAVRYKNNGLSDASEPDGNSSPGSANIQAHPNPAVEYVNFTCSNLPRDNYTLKIYNFVGKVVWKGDYALNGNKVIYLDLNDFAKGAYLYSLSDGKGNIIGTKRLVVLKP
ncbi:MAG TPA: T9SS type A sorting domain-containing protein [Saprospiraceae bacterium]|nr:T9SS type A sorting domain-containing protein [Saprospiraceae bacterium]